MAYYSYGILTLKLFGFLLGCISSNPRFVAAARYYADSKISFEEVSLKFLTENQTDALKTFLQRKLDSVHSKVRSCEPVVCVVCACSVV